MSSLFTTCKKSKPTERRLSEVPLIELDVDVGSNNSPPTKKITKKITSFFSPCSKPPPDLSAFPVRIERIPTEDEQRSREIAKQILGSV